jgi:hypothetical protein
MWRERDNPLKALYHYIPLKSARAGFWTAESRTMNGPRWRRGGRLMHFGRV